MQRKTRSLDAFHQHRIRAVHWNLILWNRQYSRGEHLHACFHSQTVIHLCSNCGDSNERERLHERNTKVWSGGMEEGMDLELTLPSGGLGVMEAAAERARVGRRRAHALAAATLRRSRWLGILLLLPFILWVGEGDLLLGTIGRLHSYFIFLATQYYNTWNFI